MSERTTDYIERLQLKLHEARGLVMSLIEDKAREILETSETFSSLYAWRKTVTARIVDLAEPVQFPDGAQVAPCPLCKCGPQVSYRNGFTVPEGLTRHLWGSHGLHRCEVMTVAEDMALGERGQRI